MKTAFVFLTLLANLALAHNYRINDTDVSYTIIHLSSVDATIASIRLNDSGVLTVTKHDRSFKTLKLSQTHQQDFFWAAQLLVEADLETETRTALCEILIPAFAQQNLKILDTTSRTMKLVLSPSSCAMPIYTHPKEEHLTEMARAVKAELIALAHQLIVI